MTDVFQAFESWLNFLNVQLLGLKPFHLNVPKTLMLAACAGAFLWTSLNRDSASKIARLMEWVGKVSSKRETFVFSGCLAAILGYLSLRQFYCFTSEGYDLAIYSNSLWHTVHGEWFFDSVKNENLMGDHFGPILFLIAQLYRIWESPVWLLLLQVIALGIGGVGLGLLAHHVTGSTVMVALLLLLYGTNPYLHSVAALDFHPIALAVPIFLWLLYFLDRERYGAALVLAGLSLLVEESLPPGLAGIGLYLALFQPRYRWTGLLMVTVGSVWFLVEVAIFLPHFSQHSLIHWDRYENLGPDFRHALYNLAVDPIFLVKEAFISHYKYYYLLALLFSVGFLPVLAWRQATLILLPAMMMLLSGNGGHYKFGFHYSAAVLPFLFYSSAHGLACLQKESLRMPNWVRSPRLLSSAVLALLILNIYQIRGYRLSHVDAHHVEAIRAVINFLPPDASVRAEGNVVAMLSSRHRIAPVDDLVQENFGWWYPDYFVLDYKHVGANPQHLAARRALLDYLVEADRYHIIVQIDDVVLLRQIRKSDGHCGSAC